MECYKRYNSSIFNSAIPISITGGGEGDGDRLVRQVSVHRTGIMLRPFSDYGIARQQHSGVLRPRIADVANNISQ